MNMMNPMGYMNPWQQAMAQAQAQNAMIQAQQAMAQAQQAQQAVQPQVMQPAQPPQPTMRPMIHADMIVVHSEDEARQDPIAAGVTQIYSMQDESAIFVKGMHQDGRGYDFDVYAKQPPKPAPEYMTRDQVANMIRSMTGGGENIWMNKEDREHGAE